jgi:1-acyl-sn-glycerol-3-phosphate acyltransferase
MGFGKEHIGRFFGRNYGEYDKVPEHTILNRVLRFFYQFHKWLIFFPILLLTTAFLGSLAVFLAMAWSVKVGSQICGVYWARINSWVTPMFVSITGRENVDERQSYVIVSNHQSHFDIFVLYGWLGIDFKWVMKAELRKVPFLGYACEKLEHIYIDRSNHDAAVDSINRAKTRIVDGTSVVFFPEGTRSKTGQIRSFKKGAFRFALDIDTPILPITIVGTKNILPKGTVDLYPGRAQMIIHPPISLDNYSHDNIEELMEKTRVTIQSGLPADYA